MAFNGAVFSLILTDLITPDTAQHVILMASTASATCSGSASRRPTCHPADRSLT
jgi:hypothetical protein